MIKTGITSWVLDLVFWLARLAGLEPATGCLEGSCSVHLSYRRPDLLCMTGVTCSTRSGRNPPRCGQHRQQAAASARHRCESLRRAARRQARGLAYRRVP